jgi:hypothetical protein
VSPYQHPSVKHPSTTTTTRPRDEGGGVEAGIGISIPKRVPDNQERNIDVLRIVQDLIAGRLHHLTIRDDDFAPIVLLLLEHQRQLVGVGRQRRRSATDEDRFVDEQNAGVRFEVDARGFAHDFKAFDCYVRLVGETKSY